MEMVFFFITPVLPPYSPGEIQFSIMSNQQHLHS